MSVLSSIFKGLSLICFGPEGDPQVEKIHARYISTNEFTDGRMCALVQPNNLLTIAFMGAGETWTDWKRMSLEYAASMGAVSGHTDLTLAEALPLLDAYEKAHEQDVAAHGGLLRPPPVGETFYQDGARLAQAAPAPQP